MGNIAEMAQWAEWRATLKPGDQFAIKVSRYGNFQGWHILTVARITRTQVIAMHRGNERRFSIVGGREIGGDSFHKIQPITQEIRDFIERTELVEWLRKLDNPETTLEQLRGMHAAFVSLDPASMAERPLEAHSTAEIGWMTTRTKDGKQTLAKPLIATNPHYCAVHKEWEWIPIAPMGGWIKCADRLPDTPTDSEQEFTIACRRSSGKVHVFAAIYLNAKLLQTMDDDCPEDGKPFTGWYFLRNDESGDFDTAYFPVCESGDEVTHWMPHPAAPQEASDEL